MEKQDAPFAGSFDAAGLRLVDALEEQDDVDNVYTNSDIPADVLAELAKE